MIVPGQLSFTIGENKPIGIQVNRIPPVSFAPTATITIYGSAGSAVVTAAACTVTAGAPALVSYQWAPTTADTYDAVFLVTDGTVTTAFKVTVIVSAQWPVGG